MTYRSCKAAALSSVATVFIIFSHSLLAEEFSFDASAYGKKSFELGGYIELNPIHQDMVRSSALYLLDLQQQRPRRNIDQTSATLELEGKIGSDKLGFNFRSHSTLLHDHRGEGEDTRFYDAYVTYKPTTGMSIDAGKKTIKWGKGYAWNPVGFVERAKDPNDPDLGREGYKLAMLDYIHSYPGNLKTLAITPVILPVSDNTNEDFGKTDHINLAVKAYVLYKDTDIDFMFLSNGSRSGRYGIDFSRNITTNFEIHGEWAYISQVEKTITDLSGNTYRENRTANSYLLGVRYLTENDTTVIAEYYRNGAGYSSDQLKDFYQVVHTAENAADTALLNNLGKLARQGYAKRNPGRNYLYVRLSNKEPFDILYFTPAITAMVNLDDSSYSLAPELVYTGITNLELRARATILEGNRFSEFGEKTSDRKLELRLRYYF
jgi:hypothetical protein